MGVWPDEERFLAADMPEQGYLENICLCGYASHQSRIMEL